jgi:hypothetical protein
MSFLLVVNWKLKFQIFEIYIAALICRDLSATDLHVDRPGKHDYKHHL